MADHTRNCRLCARKSTCCAWPGAIGHSIAPVRQSGSPRGVACIDRAGDFALASRFGLGFGTWFQQLRERIHSGRGDRRRSNAAHCGTRSGLLTSMQFLGSAAGLLLAARAVDALGWRMVFLTAAAATLVAAFASIVLVRTSGTRAVTKRAQSGCDERSCPRGRAGNFGY